jgi:hypothetical protein
MIRAGKLHVVYLDRRAHSCTCCECSVDRFECVGLHAPLVEPGLDCVEVVWSFWEAMVGSLSDARIAVISKGCCGCCWGSWKVRGVYEILEWPEDTALWNTAMDWG